MMEAPLNVCGVGSRGTEVVMTRTPFRMSPREAMELAAWLVVVARQQAILHEVELPNFGELINSIEAT